MFNRLPRNRAKPQISGKVMFRLPVIPRLRRPIARFAAAREGNIAVLFAIALVPIIGLVGAAIDYSRAVKARTSMQAAIDSAALMMSKDLTQGTLQASDITDTTATKYFKALYTDPLANDPSASIHVSINYTPATSSAAATIVLSASGSVPTQFIRVLSRMLSTLQNPGGPALANSTTFDNLGFNATSTTTWGNVKMRVALALDNTGSMAQDGKITALRNAVAGSGGLIDQLSALSKTNGDVYISVIPFAKTVNVGSSNSGQSWIDWTDWLNPPTTQPNNGTYQATLPVNWHAVGPGAKCPFTNSVGNTNGTANGGFVCKSSPTASNSSTVSTIQSTTITVNGASLQNPICPTVDAYSHTQYNGCWSSEPTGLQEIFCSGSGTVAARRIPRATMSRVAPAPAAAAAGPAPATPTFTTRRSPALTTSPIIQASPG
jgi:Flp pilus assembly protein TadG